MIGSLFKIFKKMTLILVFLVSLTLFKDTEIDSSLILSNELKALCFYFGPSIIKEQHFIFELILNSELYQKAMDFLSLHDTVTLYLMRLYCPLACLKYQLLPLFIGGFFLTLYLKNLAVSQHQSFYLLKFLNMHALSISIIVYLFLCFELMGVSALYLPFALNVMTILFSIRFALACGFNTL